MAFAKRFFRLGNEGRANFSRGANSLILGICRLTFFGVKILALRRTKSYMILSKISKGIPQSFEYF